MCGNVVVGGGAEEAAERGRSVPTEAPLFVHIKSFLYADSGEQSASLWARPLRTTSPPTCTCPSPRSARRGRHVRGGVCVYVEKRAEMCPQKPTSSRIEKQREVRLGGKKCHIHGHVIDSPPRAG